ncbi:MAG: LytTR family transcriptional regulator [Cyclobacteriaceae bacterium]
MNVRLKKWLLEPFKLLDRKRDRLVLIISVGVFSFFFMYIFNPFNLTRWYGANEFEHMLIFLKFTSLAMVILFVMELGVRPLLKLDFLRRYSFILFLLLELVVFSIVMYFFYELITKMPAEGMQDFLDIFRYSTMIISIPYSAVLFYFHHNQIILDIPSMSDHLIKINDENGKLFLAINQDQILSITAADNYVTVYYDKNGQVSKELVRTSLKKLETELSDTPIIRCSRSSMVNIKNIVSSKTESRQLVLGVKNMPSETLKVSKNYKTKILSILNNQGKSA